MYLEGRLEPFASKILTDHWFGHTWIGESWPGSFILRHPLQVFNVGNSYHVRWCHVVLIYKDDWSQTVRLHASFLYQYPGSSSHRPISFSYLRCNVGVHSGNLHLEPTVDQERCNVANTWKFSNNMSLSYSVVLFKVVLCCRSAIERVCRTEISKTTKYGNDGHN